MESFKFKNRWYEFEKSIQTQLSTEYVPDWGLFHAIRESVQNMVDERTLSGATTSHNGGDEIIYFYDRGRGVEFEDILYLGVSGKRGLDGVVGQHGEGEVVSFLVASRLGIKKTMASKDWLVRGRIENVGAHKLLVLDVYHTDKPRKGTGWMYEGPKAFETYLDAFLAFRPKRGRRKRILVDEPGQLYTRGMKVNKIDNLLFGYDLDVTPGRDRGGFTFKQVEEEIRDILEKHATSKILAALLKEMRYTWNMPFEGQMDLTLKREVVQHAIYLYTGSRKRDRLAWAILDGSQSAQIADARGQDLEFLSFRGLPPVWIQDNLPNISKILHKEDKQARRKLPALLRKSVDNLKKCISFGGWTACLVTKLEGDSVAMALMKEGIVVLSRRYVKEITFETFVGVMAHEIAHISTKMGDCTRAHEQHVRWILTNMIGRLMEDPKAQKAYRVAQEAFNQYRR